MRRAVVGAVLVVVCARWVSGNHSGVVASCYFASVVHTLKGPRVTFAPIE